MLLVSTNSLFCNLEWIIFLSYACIGSKVIDFLVFITVLAIFSANSSSVFSLFSLYPSTSNIIRTLFSIPFPATEDKIFWKAYNVSPLYPIKNPDSPFFMFTFNPKFDFSIVYCIFESIFSIKSSKNYLISEFEYLKLIEAMEVKQDEK